MIADLRPSLLLQPECTEHMALCTRRSVLEVKLSYDGECLRSVLDVGKDILIVPQASIGGKLKGKSVQ